MGQHKKIGQILVEKGLLDEAQLAQVLAKQQESGEKFGEVVVGLGLLTEVQFLTVYTEYIGLTFVDLDNYDLDLDCSRQLPESQARLFRAILLEQQGEGMLVGIVDPQDIFAVDELTRMLGKEITLAVVTEKPLIKALDMIYRRTDDIHSFAQDLGTELEEGSEGKTDKEKEEVDTAVSRLVYSLFEDALQVNASDVHIEPDKDVLRIRLRVDGQLQEQIIEGGKTIASALAQRLKLMSGLNIAERRLPQDGRFNIVVRQQAVDIRLSTMPIQYGESIVMRILNQSGGMLNLNKVGMPLHVLEHFRNLIHLPKGIILVTGPTGSGKTTTLYGALNEMNDISKKFITIEDPVEYRLERINQVQVRSELGLDFARVLRTALRQDPDIILVGEIRDIETASIALRAALTGHLVLATLHTNDAASTAMRLLDMGAEGYLVAATVKAALAQRLVRRICERCKQEHTPTDEEQSFFAKFYPDFASHKYYEGKGCDHCNNTGYSGRVGVYELLEYNEEMKEALRLDDANQFAKLAAEGKKDRSLLKGAFDFAKEGITSLSEGLRIAGEQD